MPDEQLDALTLPDRPDSSERSPAAPRVRAERASKSRPEKRAGPLPAGSNAEGRSFFPCNREDALVMLGSLFISPAFFLNSVRLAVQGDSVAVVASGLKRSEEKLLTGDRPERFPMLVEVRPAVMDRAPRTVAFSDVLRLVFRSKEEAEDFRFRPVEEFDTEVLEAKVEPALFGGDGEPRFEIRPPLEDGVSDVGYFADRLVAGVHGVLTLARLVDQLRTVAAEVLSPEQRHLKGDALDFGTACDVLHIGGGESTPTRRQKAIVAAFANDEGRGTRPLIESIVSKLAAEGERTEDEARQEKRWESVAHDVIRGRVELGGDHASDEGSLLLRAALLGAVVDKPVSVVAFLRSEKPSGNRVSVLASFLAGLKTGVLKMPWKEKVSDADWISSLIREIVEKRNRQETLTPLVAVRRSDADHMSTIAIHAAGHEVVSWSVTAPAIDDKITKEWSAALTSAGYQILGAGSAMHSWLVALSSGQVVEIITSEEGELSFPLLRYYFDKGQKFKRVKEVSQALDHGGMFWHRSIDASGREHLYCDVPSLPTAIERTILSGKLDAAIALSTVARKPARQKAARAARSRRLSSPPVTAEPQAPDAVPTSDAPAGDMKA